MWIQLLRLKLQSSSGSWQINYFNREQRQHIFFPSILTWGHGLQINATDHSAIPSLQVKSLSYIENRYTSIGTRTPALSNSMKLSHACGATQDGRVMVERFDRMWSTGEGNGKPLQYSCLENPMNSMKKQNDRILKEKLPRSIGAQYATGDQWRNNSRKNEGVEQKQKNTQLWMWLVIEARSDAVKSNIA